MRFQSLLLLVAFGAWTPQGSACSLAYSSFDQGIADAFQRNDHVFVARLSDFSLLPPKPGEAYLRARIDYVLLEAIKGVPPGSGTLVEQTPFPAVDGAPPAPACGPFVVSSGHDGARFIIFARRNDKSSQQFAPDPFSLRLDIQGADSEKWLNLTRTLQRNQPTP